MATLTAYIVTGKGARGRKRDRMDHLVCSYTAKIMSVTFNLKVKELTPKGHFCYSIAHRLSILARSCSNWIHLAFSCHSGCLMRDMLDLVKCRLV